MSELNSVDNPLLFIKECMRSGRVLWSYHVNMRLAERKIPRDLILEAIDSLEIIESYLEDKYFPSLLLRGASEAIIFHIQAGLDISGRNIRIVTAYRPDPDQWDEGFRVRRRKP